MTRLFAFVLPALVALFGFAHPPLATKSSNAASPQATASAPANAPVVYVSFFDLDVVADSKPRKKPAARPSAASSGRSPSNTSTTKRTPSASEKPGQDADAEETAADVANALLYAMSDNLIRALEQAGYHAERLPHGAALPKAGLRIRGVFAEADEQNRARRLLVGGEAVSPNMILFVGVNNLARPEQPLYELADPPISDARHGPVITVTSYAPAARYELSRDPSDEELQKISANIASSLTALLRANTLLSAQ